MYSWAGVCYMRSVIGLFFTCLPEPNMVIYPLIANVYTLFHMLRVNREDNPSRG